MRRLIVCSDGTWKSADHGTPTNVIKLARAVRPVDDQGVEQVVFYDAGVGTGTFFDRWTGGIFGQGLSKNVCDGYSFLVETYEPGDEIYLFGYSRGAFTARSIAGMIRKCGILDRAHSNRVAEAFTLYRKRDHSADSDEAQRFRRSYARTIGDFPEDPHSIRIRCIGVWDTVGALGIPGGIFRALNKHRFEFHDVQLSSRVEHAFHALAIDEKRFFFKPSLWTTRPGARQVVEQVWFSGAHANVGGGTADSGASDCALLWMILRASATCGLAFDPSAVARLRFTATAQLAESRTGFFRWFAAHDRPIGTTDTESLHFTAEERYKVMETYRPRMLKAYLERRARIVAADGARIPIAPPAADSTTEVTPALRGSPERTASAHRPPAP